MTKNPILDEIHETREKLLAESGGTLAGLVNRLQAEEKASRRTIREPRRTSGCTGAADSAVSSGEFLPAAR